MIFTWFGPVSFHSKLACHAAYCFRVWIEGQFGVLVIENELKVWVTVKKKLWATSIFNSSDSDLGVYRLPATQSAKIGNGRKQQRVFVSMRFFGYTWGFNACNLCHNINNRGASKPWTSPWPKLCRVTFDIFSKIFKFTAKTNIRLVGKISSLNLI